MSRRSNLVLGVVAVLVIILAVIAAVVGASRAPRTADLSTPAGATEAYIVAVVSQDDDAARDLLDPALGCTPEQVSQMYRPSRASLSVVDAEENGATASVVVEITEHGQGLFDAWAHRETFTLRLDDDRWLVTGEPWPIYQCK